LEEPVPRRRVLLQIVAAAELLPRQQHLRRPHPAKPRSAQPVGHLERPPEVLLDAAETELAEGEVVQFVRGVVGGVAAGGAGRPGPRPPPGPPHPPVIMGPRPGPAHAPRHPRPAAGTPGLAAGPPPIRRPRA